MTRLVFAIALLAAVLVPSAASATWVPGGTRIKPVHPQTDEYPYGFSLIGAVADGQGGATLVWNSTHHVPWVEYDSYSIGAQHIDREGGVLPGWPSEGLGAVGWDDVGDQSVRLIGVHPDGVGGAYVVTLESRMLSGDYHDFAGVYRLTRAGQVLAFAYPPPGLLNASYAAVDADEASGLLFVARGLGHPPPPPPLPRPHLPLYAQRVDSLGTLMWPGDELVPPEQEDATLGLAIVSDGAGGALVAWIDQRDVSTGTIDPDLYLQHVRFDGSIDPAWPAQGVQVCGAVGTQSYPALCSDGAGGAYVVWWDEREPEFARYVACVRADGSFAGGTPADGRKLYDTPDPGWAAYGPAADGLGGLYLIYTEPSTSLWRTVLHRLGSDGMPYPGWPIDGLDLVPNAFAGALAIDDSHGAFAALAAPGAGELDVVANSLTAGGAPAPGWTAAPQVLSTTAAFARAITVTRSDAGAIVAWTDSRDAVGAGAVYAQRLGVDGPVPVTVALASAAASPTEVRLRWSVGDASLATWALERRTEGDSWSAITDLRADGMGSLVFVDRAVTPGMRYGYRLRWTEGGATRTGGETWVSVPFAARLALAAPEPNPTAAGCLLRFSLAQNDWATLAIHDVGGRRIRALASGTLESGEHVRHWDLRDDTGHAVGAGLYFVTLESQDRRLTRRIVAMR